MKAEVVMESRVEGEVALEAERSAAKGYLRCARCGAEFAQGRADRKYCSDRCRAAASREARAKRVRDIEGLIGELARLASPKE